MPGSVGSEEVRKGVTKHTFEQNTSLGRMAWYNTKSAVRGAIRDDFQDFPPPCVSVFHGNTNGLSEGHGYYDPRCRTGPKYDDRLAELTGLGLSKYKPFEPFSRQADPPNVAPIP